MYFGLSEIFLIILIIVISIFALNLFRGVEQWNKNNHAPRITVDAVLKTKRTDISRHHRVNTSGAADAQGYHVVTDSRYYLTFQLKNGDRMELQVKGPEYGMLAEGDTGKLTFQGTRYLGFERI